MSYLGIETARKSLLAHQAALQTVSHNMANANTEGYSRQEVVFSTASPLYPSGFDIGKEGAGQIGTGVTISEIRRIRDEFLDNQINKEDQDLGRYGVYEQAFGRLENMFIEPSDQSLRVLLDQFFESLSDLANHPEGRGARQVVLERARTLTEAIRLKYEDVQDFRSELDEDITGRVNLINQMGQEVAMLNGKILDIQNGGGNPNDLLDRRDLLIENLSGLVNIDVEASDPDDFKLSIGCRVLVGGENFISIKAVPDAKNNGLSKVIWDDTLEDVQIFNGELRGLLDIRDDVLPGITDDLDEFAIQLVKRFNETHRLGFGLDGSTGLNFFEPFDTEEYQNTVLEQGIGYQKIAGQDNPYEKIHWWTYPDDNAPFEIKGSTYIDDIDNGPLFHTAQGGLPLNNDPDLNEDPQVGLLSEGFFEINGTKFEYDPQKDRLIDIVDRINAANIGVHAEVSPDNRLDLTATREAGYKIKSLRDIPTHRIRSRTEVLSGASAITDLSTFSLNDFNSGVSGVIRINGVEFSMSDYGSVQALMDDINYAATNPDGSATNQNQTQECGAWITYDETTDSFAITSKYTNSALTLVESGVVGYHGFLSEINIDEGTTQGLLTQLGILKPGQEYNSAQPPRDKDWSPFAGETMFVPKVGAAGLIKIAKEVDIDATKIAAAMGVDTSSPLDGIPDESNGVGDGSNALQLGKLKYQLFLRDGTETFDEYLRTVVTDIGSDSRHAKDQYEDQGLVVDNLKQERQSISGVNLDEEMISMISYQHGYNAAARVIRLMDEMLNTIISLK